MSLSANNLTTAEMGKHASISPLISPQIKKTLKFAIYSSPNEYLPQPVEGFAYANLGDRLFIFGGSDLAGHETADLYCFTLKSGWHLVETQGNNLAERPTARVAAAMTSYNQKLYLFGGINEKQGWMNDFYEFDTETGLWKRLAAVDDICPSPRDKCALVSSREKIYLYGGFGPRQSTDQSFNSGTDDHQAKNGDNGEQNSEENSSDQEDPAIKAVQNQQVAAEFGCFDDFYSFDPITAKWTPVDVDFGATNQPSGDEKTAVPSGLASSTVSALADKLLYFGGKTSQGQRTNAIYYFSLGFKKWLPFDVRDDSRWPIGRSFHSSAAIHDRYLVTFGGRDVDDWELNDLWLLDINSKQWMLAQCEGVGGVSAPCARYGQALVVLPDADSRPHVVIYGGSAELDPASGVAQDILTDMYFVPVDELIQSCVPVVGDVEDGEGSKHQHHRRKSNTNEDSGDGPTASKVQKCDDCIDI